MKLVIWWVLITISTGKFSEDLNVQGYSSFVECVQAGQTSGKEEFSCFTVSLPEGEAFQWYNSR